MTNYKRTGKIVRHCLVHLKALTSSDTDTDNFTFSNQPLHILQTVTTTEPAALWLFDDIVALTHHLNFFFRTPPTGDVQQVIMLGYTVTLNVQFNCLLHRHVSGQHL